ncbi:unnamed protein product [Mytilus coruscus]|uniref:Uncharacterized protein n=1 Tax=Mytilus coruscus TaxID=42192 RepID=A0A6J8DKN5_MYTCO|nr:unnamed protein product [Mytilus coruscus]
MAQYHRPIKEYEQSLENEVRNLTQIVTKLADVMLSTNQRNRGLADQYNLGPSDQYNRGDHQINGRSPDQYTRGRSLSNIIAVGRQIEIHPSLMPIDQQHPHQARDHRVPKDNGQHFHGQTPEISQRVGPVGQRSTPKSIGHETSPHDKTEQRPTSSSDIVIRRTIGKSLAVRGTIYGQNVSIIVDTAAMITLVNEKLIPADNEDSETITLVWVNSWLLGRF